jgi:hypothetical protein
MKERGSTRGCHRQNKNRNKKQRHTHIYRPVNLSEAVIRAIEEASKVRELR